MNFTRVYEREEFSGDFHVQWIDCTDLKGVDCYCDRDAARTIAGRMAPYSSGGIHFIDSGNYHYVSKFWTDKLKTPFSLVVFDHHPDVQPPLFDNLLSCGSWVKSVLDTNPYLRKVYIVGVAEKLIGAPDPDYEGRLTFYSDTELSREEGRKRFAEERLAGPVYISVDKDILDIGSAVTNWDQGKLSLAGLEELLTIIMGKGKVIGVDICGECPDFPDMSAEKRGLGVNSRTNEELVNLFSSNKGIRSWTAERSHTAGWTPLSDGPAKARYIHTPVGQE